MKITWVTWEEAKAKCESGEYWGGLLWAPGGWETGVTPPDIEALTQEAWDAKTRELVERIRAGEFQKLCGLEHQGDGDGVPVFDDRFAVMLSMRTWGGLMAEVEGDESPMAYCKWAWSRPDEKEPS